MDRHLQYDILGNSPRNQNQFAYQAGKSMNTTLHIVIMQTENVTKLNGIALDTFLDTEGRLIESYFEK